MSSNRNAASAHPWELSYRVLVLCLLFVSALEWLAAAILYSTLGTTETDKLVCAGCLVLAGLAVGLGVAFRKTGAPTWKHKTAVAIVSIPAIIGMISR